MALLLLAACHSANQDTPKDAEFTEAVLGISFPQVNINRVIAMPNIPEGYKMLDWKQKALDYDAYVFDWTAQDEVRPLIWLDNTRKNFDQETFGLKTTVGDARQGGGGSHEGINTDRKSVV